MLPLPPTSILSFILPLSPSTYLPFPLRAPENQTSNHTRSNRQPAHNRNAHQSLLGDFVVDQPPQTLRLQVVGLEVKQQFVVAPRLGVVA